ncbi:hypothetical protein [Fusobacterium animalis]|uniref:hypothetical protein n=1 Tax=Fusobacterium animalis TaxID=76859 RepID=UPI0030D0F8AE
MAKYTENIRLAQPEGSDYYDIEVFNHNSELIDKKIGEMDTSLSTIKEGATREKAGIVQLGTEEGKALEGMMLARLAGAYGYGGDIQDEGVKNPNYIYYDRNTRKMYKCLKQNQDISANVANFVPLDNNSLLERLENLRRKSKMLLYNAGSLIPNNSISAPLEEWDYFTFGIGTGVNNGKDRMAFLIRNSVQYNGDILRFQGIELEYNSRNKTLRVINNGGNLYYIEQYSCLT